MAQETTYAGIVSDWQQLLAPVKAKGEELAHPKQETSRLLREILPESRRLALLRLGIKEHPTTPEAAGKT